jgi:carbon-monoxide dehydrogenase large subunit
MTITEEAGTSVLGTRRLRKEDPALLTGEAVFTNDMKVPNALHLAVLRSPYAHARIVSVDVRPALALPGVRAAYSGADVADLWAAPMPCAWPVTDDMKNPAHYPLATSKAHYAGDGVACVLADSDAAARDALEAIVVEYEALPAVIDLEDALSDRVVVHDELGTNTSYTWNLLVEETEGAVEAAFAAAAHTVSERYVQQRLIPMAMEPRAVVAMPQPFGGDMTLYSSTQIPHILKVMTAITLGIPEHQMRVVAPAVGGGFGAKLNVYAEELLCVALARKHGTPVRWNEERSENSMATIQGRGQIQRIELAADENGKLTAVRVRLIGDMGAYLQLVTPGIPLLGAFLYAGVYELPKAYDFSCTSVFTTMTPTDAYRGAGRPEATYAIERAMDALADLTRPSAASRTTPATTTQRPRKPPRCWGTTSCAPVSPPRTCPERRSASASGCRPTSRCAGSLPRACSRHSTTRPAAGRRPPFGCCPPRRCRWSPGPHPTARAMRRRGR